MAAAYSYYQYEGLPCRVETKPLGTAEIYKSKTGFVEGPKMTILSEGVPISKSEFDAMIMALVKKSNASN